MHPTGISTGILPGTTSGATSGSTPGAIAGGGAAGDRAAPATRSAALYERACRVMPGGVSRNTVLRSPHPAYLDRAEGCRIVDLEGATRLDFANNMASMIHGHAYPPVVGAVAEQLARGTGCTLATEAEVLFAEHIVGRNSAFERVRFVNSGTEAIMAGIKAARAFTGRAKIAKVEGAYHGGYDYAEVSQESRPESWGSLDRPNRVPLVHGAPRSAVEDVIILPFNDVERAVALLDEHRNELACVLLDLMPHRAGLCPAEPSFAAAIREWTSRHGALLLLDEVITFRTEVGGMQTRYGIAADLTAMGKFIGGGFPAGAIAGRADVMQVMNPHAERLLYPLSGTFSANPVTMIAGLTALRDFDAQAVARLNALAERAMRGIGEAIARSGAPASVTGAGSIFRIHMKATPPRSHRDAHPTAAESARTKALLERLFQAGFLLINSCSAALSTPMTEREVDALVGAVEEALVAVVAA
ncbi:MAG TPA: aspartate aminotransferase family protein [Phycisphaerales bacterium]|nr:aspartate aminotransferase family protein [Phycisphaerales bacterium]HMP37281.1 aspartate aminotransferase family protein [Phycisphaerales bacterium]